MKHEISTPRVALAVATLGLACATSAPVTDPSATPAAASAIYGSQIVPVKGKDNALAKPVGILRVTNNLSEMVQVWVMNSSTDTYLRSIAANSSETISVPGATAGTVVQLRAKSPSGREIKTMAGITLARESCARNLGAPPPTPGCEWTIP